MYIYVCIERERGTRDVAGEEPISKIPCAPVSQEAWQGLATWLPGIDVRTVLVEDWNKRRARRARLRF